MPASACSPVGPERALGDNLPLLTYGLCYCQFTNDHYVTASLRPCWPSSPIFSSPPFTIPPTLSHPTLTTPRMMYSTALIEKYCLASPYAADSDSSPDFHDAADSELSPDRGMQIARLYDCRSYRMVYGVEVAKVGRQIKVVKVGRQFGISSVVKVMRRIRISSVWTC